MEAKRTGTVIAEGLKISGSVTAEGLVEVNGQIEGAGALHFPRRLSQGPRLPELITAERVVVDGRVEGPIQGRRSGAQVAGACRR